MQTPVFLRFSTVGGEKGSADTERDPRGFALRFYTEDGNWDLVGNNTPTFFLKDGIKFPDFIHTQKRDPQTNLKSAQMMWDFWSRAPESLHQVTTLFSDRGTPDGYRHMDGFGSHTYSLIDADGGRVWSNGTSRPDRASATWPRPKPSAWRILAALEAGGVDLLLSPMSAAAKCTGKAGAPVVAIPAGQDADGLPFGITVFAAPGDDEGVLQAATAIGNVVAQRIEPDLSKFDTGRRLFE